MKFTDGFWQMRAGMTTHYAAQVHEVEIETIDSSAMIRPYSQQTKDSAELERVDTTASPHVSQP